MSDNYTYPRNLVIACCTRCGAAVCDEHAHNRFHDELSGETVRRQAILDQLDRESM